MGNKIPLNFSKWAEIGKLSKGVGVMEAAVLENYSCFLYLRSARELLTPFFEATRVDLISPRNIIDHINAWSNTLASLFNSHSPISSKKVLFALHYCSSLSLCGNPVDHWSHCVQVLGDWTGIVDTHPAPYESSLCRVKCIAIACALQ